MNRRHILIFGLIIYGAGDVFSTALGFHYGAVESNPATLSILSQFGMMGFVLVKIAVVTGVYGVYRLFPIAFPDKFALTGQTAVASIITVMGCFVVLNNTYIILVQTQLM